MNNTTSTALSSGVRRRVHSTLGADQGGGAHVVNEVGSGKRRSGGFVPSYASMWSVCALCTRQVVDGSISFFSKDVIEMISPLWCRHMGFSRENWRHTADFGMIIVLNVVKASLVGFIDFYARNLDTVVHKEEELTLFSYYNALSKVIGLIVFRWLLGSVIFRLSSSLSKSITTAEKTWHVENMAMNDAFVGSKYFARKGAEVNPSNVLRSDVGDSTSALFAIFSQRVESLCGLGASLYALYCASSRFSVLGVEVPLIPLMTLAVVFLYKRIMSAARIALAGMYQQLDGLRDELSRRISHLHGNGEPIALLNGASYERERLIENIDTQHELRMNHLNLDSSIYLGQQVFDKDSFWLGALLYGVEIMKKRVGVGAFYITCNHFSNVLRCVSFVEDKVKEIAWIRSCYRRGESLALSYQLWHRKKEESNVRVSRGEQLSYSGKITKPNGDIIFDGKIELDPGKIYLLKGNIGEGKTTLIRVINELWPYAEGSLITPESILTLPQEPYLPPVQQTLVQSILYPRASLVTPGEVKRIKGLLGELGFPYQYIDEDDTKRDWSTLSGGEKQCVSIVRAIMQRPSVLIMDEPFAATDARSSKIMEILKRELAGVTILYTNHKATIRDEAFHDVTLLLSGGRCCVENTER